MLYDKTRPDQDDHFGRVLATVIACCELYELQQCSLIAPGTFSSVRVLLDRYGDWTISPCYDKLRQFTASTHTNPDLKLDVLNLVACK
jgi:hypothetical protein